MDLGFYLAFIKKNLRDKKRSRTFAPQLKKDIAEWSSW